MVERNAIEIRKLKSWETIASCKCCGKEFVTTIYKVNGNVKGVFCSRNCYATYKRKTMTGENNPRYVEKIQVKCDYCGKSFEKIPSLASITNRDGINHNFCSKQCYWKFRKLYYIGDKCYNTGRKMGKEFSEKIRQATLRQYATGILDRQTKPQVCINHLLDRLKINYINEYTFKYYSVDNYLPDYNLIIEVMGNYFHANPILYSTYDKLNGMQQKDVIRDKRKHTYILKYHNIEILYIWESDIKNNLDLCEKLILKYVENHGILAEYNSFNYSLNKNNLIENPAKTIPYFIVTP